MNRLGTLVLVLALLAGCAEPAAEPEPTPSAAPTGDGSLLFAPPEPSLPGAHLGRTNATPILELTAGSWQLQFEQNGTAQFILRLAEDLDPRGYSIGGRFVLALLPMQIEFGACLPADVNAIVTGIGFSNTISNDLAAGDYFVVVVNQQASATFNWQVGEPGTEGDDAQEVEVFGEPSQWDLIEVEAEPGTQSSTTMVPAGLQFLAAQGQAPILTQSSRLTHAVDEGTCVQDEVTADLQLLGGALRMSALLQSGNATSYTATFASTQAVPGESSVAVSALVLAPPS